MIYDTEKRRILEEVYSPYIDVARRSNTPIFISTPTWRVTYENMEKAHAPMVINRDAVYFLQELREDYGDFASQIKIGGLI